MKWLHVLCFIVCVVMCFGMLPSELEGFADHLEKTSKLDVILKKGNVDHDYDEDEEISDHAWEDSGKFEGDLILNDRQRKVLLNDVVEAEGLARNGLLDSTKRWPNNEVIYYIQKEHFNGDQVQAITSGIDDLAQASCIKFRPYQKGDRDAVVIQGSRRGCFSQVGYQGGYQVLNLSHRHPVGRGCFRHGTVVHELLHSLGFYHMQSSPDRDDYINVLWENIIEPARHNFRKYNIFSVSDFGVGYDYDSVLHYSRRAFSVNGQDTLVPKQSGASIGQRSGLSDKDAKKLNKMYCDADSDAHAADEEEKQKPIKKEPKSKPFQGHGIGYHQGKTVVIKLNPEAKTYKITNTIPRYHVFDHFSKTPQALSPPTVIEGTGAAKEIKYDYTTPEYNIEAYRKAVKELSIDYKNFTGVEPKTDINNYLDKPLIIPITKDDVTSNDKKVQTEHSEEIAHEDDSDDKVGTVNKAIDRLGKILKTHVYPSQTNHRIANDLEVYKIKPDYSKFFTPRTHYESDPEISKVDEAYRTKVKFFKTDTPKPSIDGKDSSIPDKQNGKDNNKTEIQDEQSPNSPHYDKDTASVPHSMEDISSYDENISDSPLYKEKTSGSLHRNSQQQRASEEEDSIYKFEYPLFKNFKSPPYYNDEENLKAIDAAYKSNSPYYNQYSDSNEEDLKHVFAGLKEVGDKTHDKQMEEIKAFDEPGSREVESSYRTSYPLRTLNKVKEKIFETPHYASFENIEHKNEYSSYYDPVNKAANFTTDKHKLLGQAVPLQNKWYTAQENENTNDKYNIASYTQPVSHEEKDTSPQKLQLVADSKTIQIHGKLPAGKEAYHLYGVLVPVTQNWYKINYNPHKSAYSIQKNKSSIDNT